MKKTIAILLCFLIVVSLFGCSPDTRKMRGLYDEEYIEILADSLGYISFDEKSTSAEDLFGTDFSKYVAGGSFMDYSQYPDDRTQGPFYQPDYRTSLYLPVKNDFPVGEVFCEYYAGELLCVTYTANHHYSLYEPNDEGITPVKRQDQIVEAVEKKLAEEGYVKYGDIDFYEDGDIAGGTGFGTVTLGIGCNGWFSTPDFTSKYFPYSLSMNKIPLYYSADGKFATAVVPTTVCGNSDALMPYTDTDKHERYALTYIVMYDTQILSKAREAGEVGLQNAYLAADAIENFRLIDEMGLDEFKEMVKDSENQ